MGPPSSSDQPDQGVWIALREIDALTRTVDAINRRIDHLDEHGTRGVLALQQQFAALQKDLNEHEGMHAEQARSQVAARRVLIGTVIGLVTPLYPLLFWVFGIR